MRARLERMAQYSAPEHGQLGWDVKVRLEWGFPPGQLLLRQDLLLSNDGEAALVEWSTGLLTTGGGALFKADQEKRPTPQLEAVAPLLAEAGADPLTAQAALMNWQEQVEQLQRGMERALRIGRSQGMESFPHLYAWELIYDWSREHPVLDLSRAEGKFEPEPAWCRYF